MYICSDKGLLCVNALIRACLCKCSDQGLLCVYALILACCVQMHQGLLCVNALIMALIRACCL